jgi:ABC-2 type transport system ATP-binding protein
VFGILLMGDRVNVRVDDPAQRLTELRARLAMQAITHAEITPIEPTIEDVFVALLGEGAA